MTALVPRRTRLIQLLPLLGAAGIAAGSLLLGLRPAASPPSAAAPAAPVAPAVPGPLLGVPPSIESIVHPHPAGRTTTAAPADAAFDPGAELVRVRADVDFWAARLARH